MKRTVCLAFFLASLPACHRHREPAPDKSAPVAQAPAEEPQRQIRHHGQGAEEAGLIREFDAETDDDSGGGGGGGGNANGPRYHDATVYVDGEARASLAYNEMPSGVKVFEARDLEGDPYHRMLVCDYFHALGVDCSKIKESHWYGGTGHIAIITGQELRRFRKSLYFKFTRDLAGKPQMQWGDELHTKDRPDLIANVAVYVDKKPPRWDEKYSMLVDDQGQHFDGIPYVHEDGRRGVRVSVDGILKARIKRNLLEGNLTPVNAGKPDEPPRYRLRDLLAAQKSPVDRILGVDLIVRDERVVRVDAADAQDVQFTAQKQHHGEMMFYFGKHYVPVLAVDVWSRTPPPKRLMRMVTLGANTADRGTQSQPALTEVHGRR